MLALKRVFTFRQGRVAARRYAREQSRLRKGLERGLNDKLTSMLGKRIRIVAQSIKAGGEVDLGDISGPLRQELDAVITAHVKRSFTTIFDYNNERYRNIGQKADAEFGASFGRGFELEVLIKRYRRRRDSYITNMSQEYGRQVIRRVFDLREEDLNLDQIARRLTTEFDGINRRRAALIARTETHSVVGAAQDAYHRDISKEYGIVMKKQWVATSDARTRSSHSAMNGVSVNMDEDFVMPDGARMQHVGDPKGGARHVINCRCVILYVDADDEIEDDAIQDAAGDDSTNADGLKVDSKGRPIGMTKDEFEKSIEGKDLFKESSVMLKGAKKRMGDSYDQTWIKNPDYEPVAKLDRFSGRKPSQYGTISSALSPTRTTTASYNKGIAQLSAIVPELDQLADTFGIPRLRGMIANRGRAIANMGDAVMGWNKDWITRFGAGSVGEVSKWARGMPASERPFNAISYFDNGFDQMRCVAYHEFGHQIHQLYRVRSRDDYFNPPVEQQMRGINTKGGATKYSQSNSKEWFAENFALWAMKREDLVDPSFIGLIDTLLGGAGG